MKIIFIDIDGVLNHELWYQSKERNDRILALGDRDINDYGDYFSPYTMSLLNSLIEKTNAKVVVSSSWRSGRTNEELQELFNDNGFKGDIIGQTPYLYFNCEESVGSAPRGAEIKAWFMLNEDIHKNNYTYVIFDDDTDMLYNQRNNFIHVDSYCGITYNDIFLAIEILK